MRTTLTLADDVYEAVKTLAQGSGKSFSTVVSDLVRRGLKPSLSPRKGGVPYFSVPPDAPVIPGNRASELLDDEGTD